MKTFKIETAGSSTGQVFLTGSLRQVIRDHYQGLPVMRGMAFQEDHENRFWGETSDGIYCARILKSSPDYRMLESLKEEFCRFAQLFPEGVDFFVFIPEISGNLPAKGIHKDTAEELFFKLRTVRFLGYQLLRTQEGEYCIAVEDLFVVEKRPDPIENPMPDYVPEPYAEISDDASALSGAAVLTRQEIEEFFEIGLEINRIKRFSF